MVWFLRLTLLAAAITAASAGCLSSEWKQFRDMCYWMSDFTLTWYDAWNVCPFRFPGSELVSIHDKELNAFIGEQVSTYRDGSRQSAWLGLRRHDSSSVWAWSDGSPYNFTSWWENDPDYGGGNCAEINTYDWGMWIGSDCNGYNAFMCQMYAS